MNFTERVGNIQIVLVQKYLKASIGEYLEVSRNHLPWVEVYRSIWKYTETRIPGVVEVPEMAQTVDR